MRDLARKLIDVGLTSPPGEPITAVDDLPDDLDNLLGLRASLVEVAQVVTRLRSEVEAKAATVLGPGRRYEYGESVVRWSHSYTWKADKEAVARFILDVAAHHPESLPDLFNPNDIRKTGVEAAARALGIDPEVAVSTLLHKKWGDEPGLQFKPKALEAQT